MANPTFVYDATTLTFRPGCLQVIQNDAVTRQRQIESTDGDAVVREVSAVDDDFLTIRFQQLHREDEGSFSGWDSLFAFLEDTVNYSQQVITFTDADSDEFDIRYWQGELNVEEVKIDVFEATIVFRVETGE